MKLIQILVDDENSEKFYEWLKEQITLNPHIKVEKIKVHNKDGNYST